jgi:hypothetical protein
MTMSLVTAPRSWSFHVTVHFGPSTPPVVPDPLPSTANDRSQLHDQLLTLADTVEAVMAPWGQASAMAVSAVTDSTEIVAPQLGCSLPPVTTP